MRQFYFRSGDFFRHFSELCLFSYPSPLERSASLVAKLWLLAIAGGFSYFVMSVLVDLSASLVTLVAAILFSGASDPGLERYQDGALATLLLLDFALRARRRCPDIFISALRSRRRHLHARSTAAYLFWHSPALVCHGVLVLWSWYTGRPRIRIRTPRFFWILIAPTLEMGEVHIDATRKKGTERTFMSIVWYSLAVALLNVLVKQGPAILIATVTLAQSTAHSASLKPADKAIHKASESVESWLRKRRLDFAATVYAKAWPIYAIIVHLVLQPAVAAMESHISSVLLELVCAGEVLAGQTTDLVTRMGVSLRGKKTGLYGDEVQSGRQYFRLLTILPGSGSFPIRCSLRCHSVHDRLSYTAISYSWGTSKEKYTIFVNDSPLLVTRSAFEVLQAARSAYRTRTVWIDQICIDQDSPRDKTQQIPLMPNIYENASEVLVWLGPSKTADLATALVDRMFLINRLHTTATNTKDKIYQPPYEIGTDAARALKRMLKASWFTRVWVIQEVVRARHNVTIRYGASSLDWDRFSWFTESLQTDGPQIQMLSSRIGYSGLHKVVALQNVSLVRRLGLVKDTSLSLPFYLAAIYRSVSFFDATKPHDRIYGLLGLSKFPNLGLQPDYNTSLQQLFVNMAQSSLVTTPPQYQLDFLFHAGSGYRPSMPDLPSWVPDWTIPARCVPFLGTEGGIELLTSRAAEPIVEDSAALASFGQQDDLESGPKRILVARDRVNAARKKTVSLFYNATPATKPVAMVLPGNILQLNGRRLEEISAVGREYAFDANASNWVADMEVLSEWLDLILRHCPEPPQELGPAHLPKVFLSMLMHGRTDIRIDYSFATSLGLALDIVEESITVLLWEGLKARRFNDPNIELQLAKLFKLFAPSLRQTCGGRRLGVSESGHIGLFLPGTEVGDWICLVSGARLPFSIRHVDGDLGMENSVFELIGPAYIQGIMHPPQVEELKEVIHLR